MRTDSRKAYGFRPSRLDLVNIDELGNDGTGIVNDLGWIRIDTS